MKSESYEIYFHTQHYVLEAGKLIKSLLENPLDIDTKKNEHDFVTNIDRMVELFLVEKIKKMFPSHTIISEEGYGDTAVDWSGYVWGIDPIDGTSNLVYKRKDFAISVGLYRNGIGILGFIYDVANDILYSVLQGEGIFINGIKVAPRQDKKLKDSTFYCRFNYIYSNEYNVRDVINNCRHLGYMPCASLGFVELALGNIDIMLGKGHMKFWDIAAGKIFADEANILFKELDGTDYSLLTATEKDIIACGPNLYKEFATMHLFK
ncbi:inositol monophosphatase family protein, partial [Enterococcus faecalis]|nr:inositol monophosphatase family protein [Enterococcus faecalis]